MDGIVTAGHPAPLGVTLAGDGVNVAVFSRHGHRIDFCLFDATGDVEIARIPLPSRTGDVHHGRIAGIKPGSRYGIRAHGPYDPARGHWLDPDKLLIEPYAVEIDRPFRTGPALFGRDAHGARQIGDSAGSMPKAIIATAPTPELHRPSVAWADMIIYEVNIRAFTRLHPDVPEAQRGTFAGLAHPAVIDHLTRLGITTVELMPAMAWIDERHLGPLGLTNAWGYNPAIFGAPDPRLAPGGWSEVVQAIAALHAAGLEVLLDVVFNHSGEGDETGPIISFRGLDNAAYYRMQPDDPGRFINDMGTGNCLALDRPHNVQLAMDMLRRWSRAGIDGFRFDLGPALGRRETGFDPAAPLLMAIEQDPELSHRKMIAEPWDIGPGGYQLGQFPTRWGEWSDRYRDTIRRFWRGDGGMRGDLATRLAGSSDIFAAKSHPSRSINFITAHDGFTLADLVSYAAKHNAANGEDNRDGHNENHSWNNGAEGPSDVPGIVAARRRDQINLLATLLFSRGTPMLGMGAELGHSQQGNNNAYAQDNAIGWLDWAVADTGLIAAARAIIALRRDLPQLRNDRFPTGRPDAAGNIDLIWLRPDGAVMSTGDWHDASADALVMLHGRLGDAGRVAVAFNRGSDRHALHLPDASRGHAWQARFSTDTVLGADAAADVLPARSVVVLVETPITRRGAGTTDATLGALASLAGIGPSWWDHSGTLHHVSPDTQRALLTSMGLDVTSETAARAALIDLRARRASGMPEAAHARAGAPVTIPFASLAPVDPPCRLIARDADGRTLPLPVTFSPMPYDGTGTFSGTLRGPPLPAGRYTLVDERAQEQTCALTVAPPRCHPLPAGRHISLACQLYALRSADDQGIGDLTTLRTLAVAAGTAGITSLGINPLHALFPTAPDRASPYHPSDRRFLEPTAIDLACLLPLVESAGARATVTAALAEGERLRHAAHVDYAAVATLKRKALRAASDAFIAQRPPGYWKSFTEFCRQQGEALETFAAFRISEQAHAGPWQHWPQGIRKSNAAAIRSVLDADPQAAMHERFCQWVADRDLAAAASAARDAGMSIGLYRDLAVGCAPDGAEAWAAGDLYAHGASVGAPPDPFSADGQVWHLPPPNPLTMARGGYRAFRDLIAANMRHAGMLRIDHVMGLTRLYWLPDGGRGSEGAYVSYPRDALLAELALESVTHRCAVVGEDLGTVPDGFREALAETGVLSYRVLWFERDGARLRPPSAYPAQSVACVATHDLATLAGWWAAADVQELARLGRLADVAGALAARAEEKRAILTQLQDADLLPAETDAADAALSPEIAAAIHAYIAATPAIVAAVQADDLCGEMTAVNLPGTDRERANWRRRLAVPAEHLLESALANTILTAMARARPAPPAAGQS